jgi:hypothetical protein
MCNPSLARKSVSVYLEQSSVEVDQLAGQLGGNCYDWFVGDELITQAFVFNQESFAEKFYKAVEHLPDVYAVEFSIT